MIDHFAAPWRALPVIVRASPHYYYAEEEIDRLTTVIGRLAPHR